MWTLLHLIPTLLIWMGEFSFRNLAIKSISIMSTYYLSIGLVVNKYKFIKVTKIIAKNIWFLKQDLDKLWKDTYLFSTSVPHWLFAYYLNEVLRVHPNTPSVMKRTICVVGCTKIPWDAKCLPKWLVALERIIRWVHCCEHFEQFQMCRSLITLGHVKHIK